MLISNTTKLFTSLLFLLILTACGAGNEHDPALWILAENGIARINSETGKPVLFLPKTREAKAFAMDEPEALIWVLQRHRLQSWSFGGELQLDIPLHRGRHGNLSITVDSQRGHVWIGRHKQLSQYDRQGTLNSSIELEDKIVALDVEPDTGVLWVLTHKNLHRYAHDGSLLTTNIAPTTKKKEKSKREVKRREEEDDEGRSLAWDPALKSMWVASEKGLALYGEDGTQLKWLDFDEARYLVPDGQGMLWISDGKTLQYLNAEGQVQLSMDSHSATGRSKITALGSVRAKDEHSRDIWVAGKRSISQVDSSGGILRRFSAKHIRGFGHIRAISHYADIQNPEININSPVNEQFINDPLLSITLTATDKGAGIDTDSLLLQLNNTELESECIWDGDNSECSPLQPLPDGYHRLDASVEDYAGNKTDAEPVLFTIDSRPPNVADVGLIHLQYSADGTVSLDGDVGAAEADSTLQITNLRTGETISVTVNADGSFSAVLASEPGDKLEIRVSDQAGNTSPVVESIVPASSDIPPDPATVAPPVDPTRTTTMLEATEFLYTGNNPIQRDVVPGSIVAKRVAVLRGRVLDNSGQALSGVNVSVQDHPEYGYTLSRADGMFDIALNGGGLNTINFSKEGFLSVQRKIDLPWEDFTWSKDIVLTQLDSVATPVELGANTLQIARGSIVEDKDGQRQATLLIPAGTQGELVLPDGSVQPLTSATVRATEYTIGPDGPKAMPGELPSFSGYTYAVELSLDEAIAAGAKEVRFNQPIPFYVDNFLDFPVGGVVPTGWYDRDKAAWMPSANGRVVKILSINNGMVDLDVDGSGQPASPDAMAQLGITQEERQRLATLYSAGKSLWRMQVEHFTPWDCNWPYGLPDGAARPAGVIPDLGDKEDKPDCADGSIIECQNQALGESIPITGTPFSLNYRSDRVSGRKASYTLNIPISGDTVPAGLKRIELIIEVAGTQFQRTFPVQPNLSYLFEWDGKDGFGRKIQGVWEAEIKIGYVYDAVYYEPSNFSNAFSAAGSGPIGGSRARNEIILWQIAKRDIGLVADMRNQGIGAWSITPLHYIGGELWRGDGGKRRAQAKGNIVTTVAGTGVRSSGGDGGPSTEATVSYPNGLAVSPDGSVYISEESRIRKIEPDGIIHTIAGGNRNIYCTYSGEGGPAVNSRLCPGRMALDADGNLYIIDNSNHSIRRIGQDGVISTVAGTGSPGYSGDGGPAKDAMLNYPVDLDIGDDGSIYIADFRNNRIRRIGPDGIITAVAGNGSFGYSGDGGPAVEATIAELRDVTVAPDGGFYFVDQRYIRHVGVDGVITTVAGGGKGGDGGPAIDAFFFNAKSIETGVEGSLYILDRDSVRRIGADGNITKLAGTGVSTFGGDEGNAVSASFYWPSDLALGPDGGLFVADSNNNRIRRIDSTFGSLENTHLYLASEDGREIYEFEPTGRHVNTLNATNNHPNYHFVYDSQGYIIQIEDADGNITDIERDSSGQPLAIVAPRGQRTEFTLDANGYLATLTNPAGETWSMSYTEQGLLTQFGKPRGNISKYTYDALGRLVQNRNPLGGGWNLVRTELATGYEASMTSAEGRTTRYTVMRNTMGERINITTYPDGTEKQLNFGKGEKQVTTSADGTITEVKLGPDPRFGMDASVYDSQVITTPARRRLLAHTERQAELSNRYNLLTLNSLTESQTINGRINTKTYTKVDNTWRMTSPAGRNQILSLNAQGKPILSQFFDLSAAHYSYDSQGRMNSVTLGEASTARTTTMSYDTLGNLVLLTDSLGHSIQFEYDKAGRVTKQVQPDGRTILYSYDKNGNLTSLAPPGRAAHIFEYDTVDKEINYHPPTIGTQPTPTFYRYNLDKELTEVIRPDGKSVKLIYSTSGKVDTLSLSRGIYHYAYNGTTGQLSTITSPDGGTVSYSYDGFLPISTTWSGGVNGSVSQVYDNNFWMTERKVNNQSVTYAYDNDGLLIQAGDMSLSRNANNGLLMGTGLGNINTSRAYNSFGEIVESSAVVGTDNKALFTYEHDVLGRITAKTEVIVGVTISDSFQYDQGGRLISATRNNITTTWGYDANGNRTHVNGTQIASYDEQDRLVSYNGITYSYTQNGELLSKTEAGITTQFDYDELGNLLKVALPGGVSIDYLVDGKNRRIGKKVNGQLVQAFLYKDQLNPVAELDGQGNILSRFVYADKKNVPSYMIREGKTYRIISDHLGSPRLVMDSQTGAVVQSIDYDVWGNVLQDSNPGFQPFGYAGGIYDQHTKLARFGFRDYDPQTSRWTSKDPIRFGGGDTNLYGYVLNNPVNTIDPYGLEGEFPRRLTYEDVYGQGSGNMPPVTNPLNNGPIWNQGDSNDVGAGSSVVDLRFTRYCVVGCPGGDVRVEVPYQWVFDRNDNSERQRLEEEMLEQEGYWDRALLRRNYCR